jgi:hypothetical protein
MSDSVESVQPHVKITMQMMYAEQLETNKLLTQTVAQLEQLSDLPERVRAVELAQARMEWIDRIAKTALGAGILGFGTALVNLILGR